MIDNPVTHSGKNLIIAHLPSVHSISLPRSHPIITIVIVTIAGFNVSDALLKGDIPSVDTVVLCSFEF